MDSIREGEILVGGSFWYENSTGVRQNHNILSGVCVDSSLFSMGSFSSTRFQWGERFIHWGEKMGHFWKYFSLGWRVGWIPLGHRGRGVKLLCDRHRISSNKCRGAYQMFVILGAALKRGRRLFWNLKVF